MQLHVHACPKCHEVKECEQACQIEPDLGTRDGLPMAQYATCLACEAVDQTRELMTLPAVAKAPPTHYRTLCITMYVDDIEQLDAKVAELKARGLTKANRSALIRHALKHVDLETCEPGM